MQIGAIAGWYNTFWRHFLLVESPGSGFHWAVAVPALTNPRELGGGGGGFDVIFQSKGIPN